MKLELCLIVTTLLFSYVPVLAQSASLPPGQDRAVKAGSLDTNADQGQNASGYEILAKNPNVDFGSYADGVLQAVREKWYPLIPRSAESSDKDLGTTVIEFVVRREGTLGKMKMVESSGNNSLDTAAWNGIKSAASFAPTPPGFHLKSMRLRFHFRYHRRASAERPTCGSLEHSVYFVGGEVKAPREVNQTNPEYSEEARITKYQGSVTLRTTVGPDGLPSDVCVVRALGGGLDEKAVAAVGMWKFEPATKNGTPVPVAINVEVSFHLF